MKSPEQILNECKIYSSGETRTLLVKAMDAYADQFKSPTAPSNNLSVYETKTLGNNNKCWYCGIEGETTADHFWPKSMGGKLKVRACRSCNELKKNLTPRGWLRFISKEIARLEKYYCFDSAEKWKRAYRATQSLWDRVKWSV